ncbi:MAG: hypothetical protein R2852_07095 [Bacteroidia bacterium]
MMQLQNSGQPNSYVSGPMIKIGDDPFTFPIGKSGKWARLAISAILLLLQTHLKAEYFNAPYSNTSTMASTPTPVLNNVSVIEYWTCDRIAGTSSATTIVLGNFFKRGK